MFTRFRTAIGIALLLALGFALPAFAGGWAVITLDVLPTGVVAGEPLTIGFTVLQHGRTPMNDLDPILNVHLSKTDAFVVHAKHDDKPGHYIATFTFPKAGEWEWSVQAFTMDQAMPELIVAAPAAGSASQPSKETTPGTSSILSLTTVRVAALAIGLVGLVVAYRRRSRLAAGLTVLCLLAGIGSFMMGAGDTFALSRDGGIGIEAKSNPGIPQAELGRQLFIAKGCIICHSNTKAAARSEYLTVDVGPNLSKFSASPEVLRLRLKDPTLVKSDTQMPNLNLSEAEIEALIAFINSE